MMTPSRLRAHPVLWAASLLAAGSPAIAADRPPPAFGPDNPFYRPSTLPFHAPAFDRIRDGDYQPAIEAGIARHLAEVDAIADNPAPPTFANTFVALEESGRLYYRVTRVFDALAQADTDPAIQKVREIEAPRRAAHDDAIFLNAKLFRRIAAIHARRHALPLDPEALRLVEVTTRKFVQQGAQLSDSDKRTLKKLDEEESALSDAFTRKLLAAAKDGAYSTTDPSALAGLSPGQMAAAAQSAKDRRLPGWVLPLQNTTQQPDLAWLSDRSTRRALFEDSWNRAERGGPDDTRATVARLAQLRAEKARLLGFPNYAAWTLQDQMAKNPEAVVRFLDALVPAATAQARREAAQLQARIDSQHGGFALEPWDWEYYASQVRRARYHVDESQVRPYFELTSVLKNGVFFTAHALYGITFKERPDIPVYNPDVRVFEVFDADGKPLALWYGDYFRRDNKDGGAWMDVFVPQSKLFGTLPVVYNVANFTKPAPGQPALISFDDVTTMFHEFGHALHAIFSDVDYPSLSGTSVPRDFVEFPSQFNEHWASYPAVFRHYALYHGTGAPMPAALEDRIRKSATFDEGYAFTELLAAAELDMSWHMIPAGRPLENPDSFEDRALADTHLDLRDVPPRYRSSTFLHIWSLGYSAAYYAYLWSEMLDDDAFAWFDAHGGLTRANGERFRRMILSRGNTEDLATLYQAWLGRPPSIEPMLRYRGLAGPARPD